MHLTSLRDLLAQHFNKNELRQLCFDLVIEYENLPGDIRPAKAQALVEYCLRHNRLSDLVVRCRQLRPTVSWPDPPPPADLTTQQKLQAQAQALFAQAKRLLSPLMRLPAGRDALFSEAFYPAHEWVLDQIDFSGATAVFLPRCWQTLLDYGPDGYLHALLLRQLRQQYGVEQQQQIDDLIAAWQHYCARQVAAGGAIETRLPSRQPMIAAAGQPTLFLSYAHRDAHLARQLQAELAAFGHACHLPSDTHRGSDEWLAATAAGLGSAYAVLLLVGAYSVDDRWQRIEYLGAADRQKPIIPLCLTPGVSLPVYVREAVLHSSAVGEMDMAALHRRLPVPPAPARQTWATQRSWVGQNDALRPRLAELLYMDRLKLAELQHVAQYTRLSGEAEIRRSASGRVSLNPVVAHTELIYAPWRAGDVQPVQRIPFTDAVRQLQTIRRAVLLGDPGSGKTTTLYRLAADLIDAALLDSTAPVPLMVRLGLWTDVAEPFPDFLRRTVAELGDYVEMLLQNGRSALLLDGINEIPSDQQAAKYRQVRDFLAQQPHLMAWVSCREQDYPPDRDLGLDRMTVAPLDAVRVQEFVGNYLNPLPDFGSTAAADLFWQLAGEAAQETYTRFEQDVKEKLPDADERFAAFWLADTLPRGVTWGYKDYPWKNWLKQRAHPASLLLLATNPYMLFMLLDVYQTYRQLPANRGQLFDQFVETLLVREGLLARDPITKAVIALPQGEALLTALTELAFALQTKRTGQDGDTAALTALSQAEASRYLSGSQPYQAVSANLLTIGTDVRFAHQLLQEYFAARTMRDRIFSVARFGKSSSQKRDLPNRATKVLYATDIWPPDRWWQPTNWEEATILLAGLYSDDCTPVLTWVADAQPEVAALCVMESGAHTSDATKLRLRDLWLPRLTDLRHDPDARARAAVGRALGRITLADGTPLDNRPGVGFVLRDSLKIPDIVWSEEVPAGTYEIGGDKDAYRSFDKQQIPIKHTYRLARYPITCAQFDCFVTAPDVADDRWWAGLPEKERQINTPNFPPYTNSARETVSWYQAVAFCRWLSDKLGYRVELPHEYEWEVAARWPDNRFYPWGNQFDPANANISVGDRVGQTTAVGIYPSGKNPTLDLYDLSGNVWEWCRNKYDNPKDDQIDESGVGRVVRGGSWGSLQNLARAAYRNHTRPSGRSLNDGFRLVVVRRPPSHDH